MWNNCFFVSSNVHGCLRRVSESDRPRLSAATRISVSADDLSRRLESMSATRCGDDDRYGGARS